jgi:hypothetical protein
MEYCKLQSPIPFTLKKIIYYESVFRRSDASHCRLSLCKIDLNREKIRLDIRIRDIFEKLFDDFKIIEEYSVGSGNTS